MNGSNGHPTTPKLLRILERHANGEDVTRNLVSFAKRGYHAAEESVISLAEQGSDDARSALSLMLVSGKHYLQIDQTKRAFECCDLEREQKELVLKKKANDGEKWALATLDKIDPLPGEYIDRLGFVVEESLLKQFGTDNSLYVHHVTRHDLQMLEEELLAEGNSRLEQLLVRRIRLCYLTLHYFESIYAQSLKMPKNDRCHALLLHRMHQANDRYLAAIRTLAQIRKMRLPNVQVNIAKKQINVAS